MEFKKWCGKGQLIEALQAVYLMERQGLPLSTNIFYPLLQVCINKKDLQVGREVHCMIMRCGLESNAFLGCHLIRMFALCGSLLDANNVFSKLPKPDVFTWSAIISAHDKLGQSERAIKLYHLMQQQSMVKPDAHIFVAALKACASMAAIDEGKLIHAHIIESSLDLVIHVGNILIDMYAKCRSLENARAVFDRLLQRDVVTWNAMIAGYSQHGQGGRAVELLKNMQADGLQPDEVTFLGVLKVCSSVADSDEGRLGISQIVDNAFEMNEKCANCWSLEDAQSLFDKLPNRSLATWSAMIGGYAEHGHCDKAHQLFKRMQQEGLQPDSVTFVCILKACSSLDRGRLIHIHIIESGFEFDLCVGNSLVDMYSKCGSLHDARQWFDRLPKRNVVTWSAMIAGYAQHGHGQDALILFEQMQKAGMSPNEVTCFCAMKACSNMGAIHQAKLIHAHIIESGFESILSVGNTLIDMYAKCGSLQDARRVFDRMGKQSVVTWSAMLAGYAQHNNYELALQCFKDMQREGFKPNDVTFLCLLSACCHLGLVNEGCHHFYSMERDFGVIPNREHYNCMVDLLGRTGCLKDAVDLLQGMLGEPNVVAWMSLLSQCRIHGNVGLAKRCFDNIVMLDPRDASGYVLMANIYADAGMWEDINRLQEMKKHATVSKKPGKAAVEVKNQVQDFVVGDRCIPQSNDIYAMIKRLDLQVKKEGYMPYLDLVL